MWKTVLANLNLVGENVGLWKNLPGYQKPSGLRSGTGFSPPVRLGEEEIKRVGEVLFSAIRPAMGYKRRDLSFSSDGLTGLIVARDFELALEFVPGTEDTNSFTVRKTLSGCAGLDLFQHPGFNEVFRGEFHRMEIRSSGEVSVEDWIDRVEDRDLQEEWELRYPPDCSSCRLRLPQSDFEIEVTTERMALHRHLPAPPSLFIEQLERLAPVMKMVETESP